MTNTVLPQNTNPAVEDIKELSRTLNELFGDDEKEKDEPTDVVELPPTDDENADPVGDGSDQEDDKSGQKHLNKVKTLLNRIEILSGNEFFDTQDRARLMNIVKKMLQGDHVPYNHVYILVNMLLQMLEFLEHDNMVVMRLVSYLKNKDKFDY